MFHRKKSSTPEKNHNDKSYGFDYSFDENSQKSDDIEDIKDISKIDHSNN